MRALAQAAASSGPVYGRQLRETQFSHHAPNVLRLNNGSFGACPRDVLKVQRALQDEWNSNPDDFWHTLDRRFAETNAAVATRLLNTRVEDVFVVDNLTTGISILSSSLLSSMTEPDSVVLMSNHTYHAVRLAVQQCCALAERRMGHTVQIISVDLPFPVLSDDHEEQFLGCYREALRAVPRGKTVRFAFIDHITSVPAMKMPVRKIISLLREHGVLEVIVDAAHSPGMTSITDVISAEGRAAPDYYLCNLHKWCMAPVAAGFLWVAPSAPSRAKLRHTTMSHSCGEGLSKECAMLGTRDYSAMLSIPAALDFIDSQLGGIDFMRERNSALCYEVAELLSAAWGTSPWLAPRDICTGTAMVGCPAELGDTFEDGEALRLALRSWRPEKDDPPCESGSIPQPADVTGGIVIQKLTPVKGDRLYMRLSVAAYNYMEEYLVLRDAVLDLASKMTKNT